MSIYEVRNRTDELIAHLTDVWEASVRETHLFLPEAEIGRLRSYVPQALGSVGHLIVAERVSGCPAAFMGTDGGRLEMLFISPAERGKGLGRQLLRLGIDCFGVNSVTVNEQNPQAVGFYEHMGFRTYKKTFLDEQGAPYPLLYMKI